MKYVRVLTKDAEAYGLLDGHSINLLSGEPWEGATEIGITISTRDAKFLAPCNPSKVIGVAANYPGVSGSSRKDEEPLIFAKSTNSVCGHDNPITSRFLELSVWGEPELAIVLGKTLTNASENESLDAIFGYSVANDVTCMNWGLRDHHLARSKCADSFCPLGPYIDTQFDPGEKRISGYQNGRLIRDGFLNTRIFNEVELLTRLSKWITLEPGDVVLTGAPARTGERTFLQDGDLYRCEIEGLGSLQNRFAQGAVHV